MISHVLLQSVAVVATATIASGTSLRRRASFCNTCDALPIMNGGFEDGYEQNAWVFDAQAGQAAVSGQDPRTGNYAATFMATQLNDDGTTAPPSTATQMLTGLCIGSTYQGQLYYSPTQDQQGACSLSASLDGVVFVTIAIDTMTGDYNGYYKSEFSFKPTAALGVFQLSYSCSAGTQHVYVDDIVASVDTCPVSSTTTMSSTSSSSSSATSLASSSVSSSASSSSAASSAALTSSSSSISSSSTSAQTSASTTDLSSSSTTSVTLSSVFSTPTPSELCPVCTYLPTNAQCGIAGYGVNDTSILGDGPTECVESECECKELCQSTMGCASFVYDDCIGSCYLSTAENDFTTHDLDPNSDDSYIFYQLGCFENCPAIPSSSMPSSATGSTPYTSTTSISSSPKASSSSTTSSIVKSAGSSKASSSIISTPAPTISSSSLHAPISASLSSTVMPVPSMTTSTVFTTKTYTISSCAPTVMACSYGSVITTTISLYTTICPVTSPLSTASVGNVNQNSAISPAMPSSVNPAVASQSVVAKQSLVFASSQTVPSSAGAVAQGIYSGIAAPAVSTSSQPIIMSDTSISQATATRVTSSIANVSSKATAIGNLAPTVSAAAVRASSSGQFVPGIQTIGASASSAVAGSKATSTTSSPSKTSSTAKTTYSGAARKGSEARIFGTLSFAAVMALFLA